MKYLLAAAEEYGLGEIAGRVMEYPNVHGVIVDLDPFWLWLWQMHILQKEDELSPNLLYYWDRYRYDPWFWGNIFLTGRQAYFNTTVPFDIYWRPKNPDFDRYSNIVVKILLRPGSQTLEGSFGNERLRVVQEYRPVPRLSANAKNMIRPLEGGVSTGHALDAPGTLGGILFDSYNNKQYGLTCGHVITATGLSSDQPSQNDSPANTQIGKCVLNITPAPTGGVLCNPYNPTILNDMDLALIELDQSVTANPSIINIGNIQGFTKNRSLHPNLLVEFNGRTSNHRSLVLGGIGLVQEIDDANGNPCCFKNLLEVKEPTLTSLVLSRPVSGGDSGAWLVTQGSSGNEWCGMIIGEDRQTGYAMMSEDILNCLSSNGYSLKCN